MKNRRVFMLCAVSVGSVLASGRASASSSWVDENDPTARLTGYVHDAKRVDKVKFPRYASPQNCSNCASWQGEPGDAAGRCHLFGNHKTAAQGWCNVYSKAT